jgi:hypothetical protein
MAQKVEVRLIDDLDGGEANETVAFALDGTEYEIDLSDTHAQALRQDMKQYLDAARRIGRVGGGRRSVQHIQGPRANHRERNQAIRNWARGKGLEVSDRGRISQEIVDQYDAGAGK